MSASPRILPCCLLLSLGLGLATLAPRAALGAETAEPGLLFYLSGEKGTTADVSAAGTAVPNFESEITRIPDGAKGAALSCGDLEKLAYSAPGNIFAQRGTLSFFWRSRYAVGPTEFPVFRVGYADHSSWDMVWLRIDYNGHGFDAFVTDTSLSRTRVSVTVQPFPKPNEWTHLALAWDETRGIRFYVNGKLAGKVETTAFYNAGLDQFGPHSRIISPYQVHSDYNFVRGGDIDEVRIYDRMLADENVTTLAQGNAPTNLPALPARSLADARTRDEWNLRYGWNRPNDAPPELPAGPAVAIRKVEIHEAYDLKRWWWKANDGIRETTWPGIYNRSRLPGRHDYFTLPDWDCYVDSGKAVTFALPNEPWNHLEISGAAWGKMELLPVGTNLETASEVRAESLLFQRPKGQEKTVHALTQSLAGRQIRFTNVEQEEPIGELAAYNVTAGREPTGSTKLPYRLGFGSAGDGGEALGRFIAGRFPADERTVLVARPTGSSTAATSAAMPAGPHLPLVHVVIPDSWDQLTDGLDGLAIDLPALKVQPTSRGLITLNIQVKDPLWLPRDMLDFTFSVKPGEAKTLWLDLRDRLLPANRPLYLTIASASPDFSGASLAEANLRLVFKPRDAARPEHEIDRFTQAKDSYAMLVEEHPNNPKLDLGNRFRGDLQDLLRVNPNHELGIKYAASGIAGSPRPAFTQPAAPAGVPLWAFRQTELLGRVKRFVNWYIDHRQVAYGDFGGGISDDVDLTNTWPGVAFMGSDPEKLTKSLRALLDASYTNGMSTRGLPTIQVDELHSYEEGITCLAQNLILSYGSPLELERAMETARGIETITGVNAAGHRHIRTSYYSATKMAVDDPWGRSKPYSNLVLQVPQLLVDYNGNPEAKKYLLELADGLLAHRHVDANGVATLATTIVFATDREADATRGFSPWHVFWSAWKWTGDRKYLQPIMDGGAQSALTINPNTLDLLDLRKEVGPALLAGAPGGGRGRGGRGGRGGGGAGGANGHVLWQLSGDKSYLESLYASQIENCASMEYINTEGSLWIDRVSVPFGDIQRARLGGVALQRNSLFPGHVVSWKFAAPANDQSVAILVPDATTTSFKVIAYNLENSPVRATMTGWNIDPGTWDITQGIDTNDDDTADGAIATRSAVFERTRSVELTLAPRATTVLTFKLKTPGTPYWQRPDLGLDPQDVTVRGREVRVKIHSLGSVPTPATTVTVRDAAGRTLATATVPALAAPLDLMPKTTEVSLTLPAGATTTGGRVEIDPEHALTEITALNNTVSL